MASIAETQRWVKEAGKWALSTFYRPVSIGIYNNCMGGTDLFGWYSFRCNCMRPTRKWPIRVLQGHLDAYIVNFRIIWIQMGRQFYNTKRTITRHLATLSAARALAKFVEKEQAKFLKTPEGKMVRSQQLQWLAIKLFAHPLSKQIFFLTFWVQGPFTLRRHSERTFKRSQKKTLPRRGHGNVHAITRQGRKPLHALW